MFLEILYSIPELSLIGMIKPDLLHANAKRIIAFLHTWKRKAQPEYRPKTGSKGCKDMTDQPFSIWNLKTNDSLAFCTWNMTLQPFLPGT